jgi:hypothetical protein
MMMRSPGTSSLLLFLASCLWTDLAAPTIVPPVVPKGGLTPAPVAEADGATTKTPVKTAAATPVKAVPTITTKAPTITTKAPTITTKAPTITTKEPTITIKEPVLAPATPVKTAPTITTKVPVMAPATPVKAAPTKMISLDVTTNVPVMAAAATAATAAPSKLIDLGVNNTLNLPVLTVVGAEGTLTDADYPLQKCQGDCNRNQDCDYGLLCFSRGGATTIPGCFGRADAIGTDYCWDPNDQPVPGVIAHVGNNGKPSVLFPLPRCAGQCTNNTDCAAGLICLVRNRDTDPVYGCTGPLVDRTDYCVDPADLPAGKSSNAGSGSSTGNFTATDGNNTTPSPVFGNGTLAKTPASSGNFTNGTSIDPTAAPVLKEAAKPPTAPVK